MAFLRQPKYIYEVNAGIIKATLVRCFRDKQYISCSEFMFDSCHIGASRADVIAFDFKKNKIIEVEIKISKSDLRADLKKNKHKEEPKVDEFYFCVPRELQEETEKVIQEINPKYGLIIYNYPYKGNNSNGLLYRKNCSKLREKREITEVEKFALMKRLCYENATRLLQQEKEKSWVFNPDYKTDEQFAKELSGFDQLNKSEGK